MNTKQKNLVIGLLEYWSNFHDTTIGKALTWDEPIKDDGNDWYMDIFESNSTNTSHNFEYIAMIYKACGVNCWMGEEKGRFKFHIY